MRRLDYGLKQSESYQCCKYQNNSETTSNTRLDIRTYPKGRAFFYDPEHGEGIELLEEGQTKDSAIGLEPADFASAVLDGTELTAGPEESLGELRTELAMYRCRVGTAFSSRKVMSEIWSKRLSGLS